MDCINYGRTILYIKEFFLKILSYRKFNILPIRLIGNEIFLKFNNLKLRNLPLLNFDFNLNTLLIIKINTPTYLYDRSENKIKIFSIDIETTIITNYIENVINDKKICYFILCLIFSLFKTFVGMKIRGGFIRDMFLKNINLLDKIDLDIYISIDDMGKINTSLRFIDYNSYVNSIIDNIVNNLFRLIFNKSIDLESIIGYSIITYKVKDVYCLSYKYKINEIILSIDINFIGKHSFCENQYCVENNIDFEQNGLELTLEKDSIVCNMFRKYEQTNDYIKNELNKINNIDFIRLLIPNLKMLNDGIITNIESYLGIEEIYKFKIMKTINNYIMYESHTLCSNYLPSCKNLFNESIYKTNKVICKCYRCFEIYKRMYLRHLKFSNYKISGKCNKSYCSHAATRNEKLIIDQNYIYEIYLKEQTTTDYITFAEKYCVENSLPLSIIDYIPLSNINLESYKNNNNFYHKSLTKYFYGNFDIIYSKKKLSKNEYNMNIIIKKKLLHVFSNRSRVMKHKL